MNPMHYAVVVGINRYPALGDLTAAQADARDFYEWLRSEEGGGVPEENAHRIMAVLPQTVTVEEAQPTTDAIYRAFDRCIEAVKRTPATRWDETRLYFYCAGHGIAPGSRDAALLAANVTRQSFGNHVSCESLLRFFSQVQRFREVALFADCCRTRTGKNVTLRPPYWSYDEENNGAVQKYLACGAIYGQQAFEEFDKPADDRRGYFTRALMEGLRGAPAAIDPSTRRVTDRFLGPFIREHMRQATLGKFVSPLEAEFVIEGTGSMAFGPIRASVAAETTYPVYLQVDNAVTELNILDGVSQIVCKPIRFRTQPNTFLCQLPSGVYEAVPVGMVDPARTAWLFKVSDGEQHEQF